MGGPEITSFLTLDHTSLYGSPVPMSHASLDWARHKKKYFLQPFVLSLLLTLVLSSLQGLKHSGVGKEEGEQDTLSRIQLSTEPDPGCNSIIREKKSSIPGHD